MQGDIESDLIIDFLNRVFYGCTAQIGKIDRILIVDLDIIITVGVGGGTPSRAADDAYPIQRSCMIHIVDRPMDGNLSPSPAAGEKGKQH
jgi:hypothetical protein